MPRPDFEQGLQRIVVGVAYAVELYDSAHIRVQGIESSSKTTTKLVGVERSTQLAPLRPDVTHLEHGNTAETFFDLKVVVKEVRSTEVLVNGIHVEDIRAAAWVNCRVQAGAKRNPWKD